MAPPYSPFRHGTGQARPRGGRSPNRLLDCAKLPCARLRPGPSEARGPASILATPRLYDRANGGPYASSRRATAASACTVAEVNAVKPIPSSPAVSRRMSEQQRRDTAPEVRLRRALHACGERYRVGYPVPGMTRCTIDVAFPRRRVAVFVDGCFWHRCPEHGTSPKANSTWWSSKLDANRARDERVNEALAQAGWTVIRVWEHEPTESAAARVLNVARPLRPGVSTGGIAPTVAGS